ncbi:hypothetical protein EDC04DRAFT_2600245 [Pisolithus marmoratus]|nr:hypothetical protein EDC04DRAFT_2600245 [Pisolithus marmoratus]
MAHVSPSGNATRAPKGNYLHPPIGDAEERGFELIITNWEIELRRPHSALTKPGVGYKTSPAVSEREKRGVVVPGRKSNMMPYSPELVERQYTDGGHLNVAFFANTTTTCSLKSMNFMAAFILGIWRWRTTQAVTLLLLEISLMLTNSIMTFITGVSTSPVGGSRHKKELRITGSRYVRGWHSRMMTVTGEDGKASYGCRRY